MTNGTGSTDAVNVTLTPLVSEDVILAVIIVSYVLSLTTNLLVITVILRSETLTKSFGYTFIVCLCTFDTVASGTLGSKCIVLITTGGVAWVDSVSLMNIDGFFNAFFALSTIYSIVAITFEKFYCIKYPMHHSSHMNKMVVCVTVCIIVTLAAVIASVPLGWNGYSQIKNECRCMSLWGDNIRPFFVLFVGVVVFVIPVMTMLFVNCEVYKIAKQAMVQVNPLCGSPTRRETVRRISVINMEETSGQQFSVDSERDFTVVKLGSCNNNCDDTSDVTYDNNSVFSRPIPVRQIGMSNGRFTNRESKSSNSIVVNNSSRSDSQSNTSTKRSEPANFKALRSLLLPFSYFLLIWGSYFLLYIHWMLEAELVRKQLFETICMLIVHLSYALNPLVFGVKSGMFRQELINQTKRCFGKDTEEVTVLQDVVRSNEDFLQFLDRTAQSNVLNKTP